MSATRTPWFSWPVRPVREGWYEYSGTNLAEGARCYWNGSQWGFWWSQEDWRQFADEEGDAWRGLTEPA